MENMLAEQVQDLVLPVLKQYEVELVALKIKQHGSSVTIEIFVDKPQGGINLDACAEINREINQQLEEEDFINSHYVVSVCSPGLDWPLKTKKDFLRMQGRKIRVLLTEKVDGRGEYVGVVHQVQDAAVVLLVDSKEVTLPLDKILKADQLV